MSSYDAIVVGLGAAGSATAWQLAARGLRVLGLDRFQPPHDRGSSHGRSRIIRQAYWEGPAYVPLVLDAYERWRRLERASGIDLLRITGGLMIGPIDGAVFAGSQASARAHDLPHEILEAADMRRRFPAFTLSAGEAALFEPLAGVLRPELAVAAMLGRAAAAGAQLRFDEPVLDWATSDQGGVRVRTESETFEAARLVLAAGSWLTQLLPLDSPTLAVDRMVVAWFGRPDGERISVGPTDQQPIWVRQLPDGRELYGLPEIEPGEGMKAAFHNVRTASDPATADPPAQPAELAAIAEALTRYCPGLAGRLLNASTCRYTSTLDGHFIIDRLADRPQVVLVSACSGHGFKFAPTIGAAAADLTIQGRSDLPIGGFSLARLSAARDA
jgi:sarcosine oxidase